MAAIADDDRPHVVAVPFPAQGHIPPVIHLARKLAAQGFIVTLANVDSIHKNLSEHWSCPPGLDIRLEQVPCDLDVPAGVDAASIQGGRNFAEAVKNLQVPFEELIRRIQPTPCCIIADYFLAWAIETTKKFSIPAVTYWPANAACSSLHHHMDLLLSNGDACQEPTNEDNLISYVPGVDPLKFKDLPQYYRDIVGPVMLNFFIPSADRMKDSDWILVNSMSELEPDTFQVMEAVLRNKNFVSVGPLFPLIDDGTPLGVSLRDEDNDCLKWLDTQAAKSVLYMSFGSITTMPASTFEELAAGLEASRQPFLWVLRQGLVQSKTDEFFKEFAERTKEQGLVVSWAPQLRVLAHASVGGFLSHCGWNSIFESICYGVPILGWPWHSEQSTNCKLVEEDWKLGKRFSRKPVVDRSEVEEIIKDFMQGEDSVEIRSRVGAFKHVAQRTAKEGGASHTNLKRFMQEMKATKRSSFCVATSNSD